MFWSVFAAVSAAAVSATAAVLTTLFNLPGKPLRLISLNHTWLTYGCGNNFWHPSRWPWIKVTKLLKWVDSLRKILNPFSAAKHYICHILRMIGPIDVKQKGDESTGCYADKGPFDLDLWPWIFYGQIVFREWKARMSWDEMDGSR